jgi:hypothetical protein
MLILDVALFCWLVYGNDLATARNGNEYTYVCPFALQAAITRANSHCASLTRQ